MGTRPISLLILSLVVSFSALAPVRAEGQTGTYVAPRTPDGQPDLQGVWQVLNTAAWDIQDHHAQLGVPAGTGVVEGNEIPYLPAALNKKHENFANRQTLDPETRCFLPGVPRITYMPFPFQIVQSRNQVTILYEYVHAVRHIFLNGEHPAGPIEWWMGDSRGRWEGDTLVVDVIHFNAETWFDRAGNHHSEALHVIERYTPAGPDHINYEVAIEDPQVFTRPWKMSMTLYRRKDPHSELLEYECFAYKFEAEWQK
ncbi:MAG TPA: hypothetical protein VIK60_09955 [Vicinamibacterales bacterium]